MDSNKSQEEFFAGYATRLQSILGSTEWSGVAQLAREMRNCWETGRQVFFCGNGGSAGNASHLVNDFLYGVAKRTGGGIKALALSANPAVITCLANDVGYESIFSEQLAVQGEKGDLLIVLSGSGNSPNVVKVLEHSKTMDIKSFAILGYSGGQCKSLADVAIHFPIDDMQIAEDMQLVVGHMIMQWLYDNNPLAE
ncbi:MAG: SIS domain-containing protein [Nitrospina sp.]|jgi:D-sedoheptulose 7-phosphate isomerase|nr:SIS domain-containing protein [Nitrospina sp.]MBT3875240.1 SIS domain-containing protein [Nitrospina sp.]MBT4047620.1 SIS domain-containing protein [Nitrospina sp.]MBT4557075.1 SIS domain-containing protein [Nitrospina sp.]MBT5347206.1 SIS domain-containing protein [Nitrospina sp.]